MGSLTIEIPKEQIEAFCKKWQIQELALFGSVLREDFRPESDVDVLVRFAPSSMRSLWDSIAAEQELAELLGRRVDLVERETIEASDNWIRRASILNTAETIYAE